MVVQARVDQWCRRIQELEKALEFSTESCEQHAQRAHASAKLVASLEHSLSEVRALGDDIGRLI